MVRRLMSDGLLSQLDLRDLPVKGTGAQQLLWVPWPTIRPSSTTRMRSASWIVLTRWATRMTVASPMLSLQILAQGLVGFHVQGGEAVVKDIDLRLLHQGPGDGHALALAAGQVGAPWAMGSW